MKKWNNTLFFTFKELLKSLREASATPKLYPLYNYVDNLRDSELLWNTTNLGDRLFDIIKFTDNPNVIDIPYTMFTNIIGIYEGNFYLKDYVKELLNSISWEYKTHILLTISKEDYTNSVRTISAEGGGTFEYSQNLLWTFRNKILDLLLLANLTYEKYSTLLNFYASKKADLMNALSSSYSDVGASSSKSENFNLTNDTPQEVYNDDYSDNNYASSTSKGKNESSMRTNLNHSELHEGDTLIARLKEIEDKYSNVMQEWIKEFDKFFTSNLNVADYEEYTGV